MQRLFIRSLRSMHLLPTTTTSSSSSVTTTAAATTPPTRIAAFTSASKTFAGSFGTETGDLRRPIDHHQTAFALRLLRQVASTQAGHGNFAISPLSIHVGLALLAAGAKGRTLDDIVSALVGPDGAAADLHSLTTKMNQLVLADGSTAGGPALSCANGVFVDHSLTLKPSFEKVVIGTYKSKTEAVDFRTKSDEATHKINSWVENATNGVIKELLPFGSVHSESRLVLVNALYFKGEWKEKFDPYDTKNSKFHLLDGTSIQVPCMTTTEKQFISSCNGFKVLRLPYEPGRGTGRQFSMYVFLPDAQDGLWSLQEKISSEPESLSKHLPVQSVKVGKFKLPKFKIAFELEASSILKRLGIVSPFNMDADFSEMVESLAAGDDALFASAVHHKSFVEVNEGGTEAAAATAMAMYGSSWHKSTPVRLDFVADHPFIFLIREDRTGTILFAGHVKNPLLV